jgi:hypothetical protein
MLIRFMKALLVTYTDNLEVVVRVPRPLVSEKDLHHRHKLLQEFNLLRWVSTRTTIAISRPLQDGTEAVIPFTMTSKCEGICLLFAFGGLSYDLQVSAETQAVTFNLCAGLGSPLTSGNDRSPT